ncbi:hypothetical protein THRCLA_21857 [Thraustotheca clavata]|uniref:WWE domain-containing protein n=1 Tax=Thraustotheca clavata TaxID=74557 RepID=A0A1V9ZLT7_9STRA|nr:hypothetical protein THRCLA_21857 [Thraustotheca clavata]
MVIKRKATSSKKAKQSKRAKNAEENKENEQLFQELNIVRSVTLVPIESKNEFWMIQILQNAANKYHFSFRSGDLATSGEYCFNQPTTKSQCIEDFEASYMLKTGVKYIESKQQNHVNFVLYDSNTILPQGVWEYQNKDQIWTQIPKTRTQKLDQLWHSFLIAPTNHIHYIKSGTATYAINFLRMTQTNTKSNDQYMIRRNAMPIPKPKKHITESTIAVIKDGECEVILAHIDIPTLKDHTIKMTLSFVGDEYFFTTEESILNEPNVLEVEGPLTQEAGETLWKSTFESLTGRVWSPNEKFESVVGKYDIFAEPCDEIVNQGRKQVRVEVDYRFYHGNMKQLNHVRDVGRWYLVNKAHPKRLLKWENVAYCIDYENMNVTCPENPNYVQPLSIVKKFEML